MGERIATPVTRSLVRNDNFGALVRDGGRFVKRPYGQTTGISTLAVLSPSVAVKRRRPDSPAWTMLCSSPK